MATAVDLESQLKNDVIRFSASGFRDFTRTASDPVMWRDVFINNDEAVLEMLQRFSEDLSYLQRAIRWGEKDKLETLFTRTREIRRRSSMRGQDRPIPCCHAALDADGFRQIFGIFARQKAQHRAVAPPVVKPKIFRRTAH